MALQQALTEAFGSGFHVRPQLPIALDDSSEPEPDAVVVRGAPWDYASSHPAAPLAAPSARVAVVALLPPA